MPIPIIINNLEMPQFYACIKLNYVTDYFCNFGSNFDCYPEIWDLVVIFEDGGYLYLDSTHYYEKFGMSHNMLSQTTFMY